MVEKKVNVRVDTDGDCIKIYINDLLHLKIILPVLSVQSWIEPNTTYCIEYITSTNPTLSEYYLKSIWEDILQGLDKIEF